MTISLACNRYNAHWTERKIALFFAHTKKMKQMAAAAIICIDIQPIRFNRQSSLLFSFQFQTIVISFFLLINNLMTMMRMPLSSKPFCFFMVMYIARRSFVSVTSKITFLVVYYDRFICGPLYIIAAIIKHILSTRRCIIQHGIYCLLSCNRLNFVPNMWILHSDTL